MKPDIVIHLGLTKTASTFLQKKVFGGKLYTLDRKKDWSNDRYEAKEFQEEFLKNEWDFSHAKYGKAFFESQKTELGTLLVSHESLFCHVPYIDGIDVIKRSVAELCEKLKDISENWRGANVKVFFLYRRQVDWIPSMYANVAYKLKSPSSEDLDNRIKYYLEEAPELLDILKWDNLYLSLVEALGQENILAIPYESFKEKKNWGIIKEFVGVDVELDEKISEDYSINSKRDNDRNSWAASDKMQHLADLKFLQVFRPFAKRLFSHKVRIKIKSLLGSSGHEIKVDPVTRNRLVDYYKESNVNISNLTNVNLEALGYFE